ncbi:MAG: hypothetical protein ACTSW1_11445 [Candidatus Hodarchaeales archaeon]
MQKKLFYFTAFMILAVLGSLTFVKAMPTTVLGTDSTDDVEKVTYASGLTGYDYDRGDYKDSIDIVSVEVEDEGNGNISMKVTFQDTPVFDGYHIYWVWITFAGDEADAGSSAGAWFWAGGYQGTEADSAWWIWANMSDFLSFGSGNDEPTISAATHSMSWSTNSTYWDDLANVGNWDVQVWAWTSDDLSYSESLMSGTSYWDFYPDDESQWAGDSDNSSTTSTSGADDNNTDSSSPGFELFFPLMTIPVIAALYRKRE